MKKIFITFSILLFFGINLSYSNSSFDYDNSLNSAKLIEKRIIQLKKQLEGFKVKYEINQDDKLNKTIANLERMAIGLDKIQNYDVDKNLASNIIKTIVDELKNINDDLGPYLKKELDKKQTEIKKYKDEYNRPILGFSNKIKTIIKALAIKIKSKEKLTNKDKEIIENLKNMDSYARNLDRFSDIQFNTKTQLKEYIIENIESIKTEISSIKKTLNKKS